MPPPLVEWRSSGLRVPGWRPASYILFVRHVEIVRTFTGILVHVVSRRRRLDRLRSMAMDAGINSRPGRGSVEAFVLHGIGGGLLFLMNVVIGRAIGAAGYGVYSYALAMVFGSARTAVARILMTRKGAVRRSMRTLEAVGANVLGTAMNNVKASKADDYGYAYRY